MTAYNSPSINMAAAIILFAFATVSAAQTNCGGTQYTPGTLKFTRECYDAIQTCAGKFFANASLVDCNGGNSNLSMQQRANLGAEGSSQNNDATIAFQDIVQLCILSGHSTGTWGYSDNQWYWIAAEQGCYTNDSAGGVVTHPEPFCVQNRDSSLPECYPEPGPASKKLYVFRTAKTANGFDVAARGWNTYGIQALQNGAAVIPSFAGQQGLYYNQKFVQTQCGVMADKRFKAAGYNLCSLDSGWQLLGETDDHGRISYNQTRFNLPQLGSWLHARGLQLGVYITPGVPCSAANKTIAGTDIKIGSLFNGNDNQLQCDFDFSKPDVQKWHDSVVKQWASWGVDMLKLDFVTPGSPQNGANLLCDSSGAVTAYQKAIAKSGKKMRLDISWKLCRNETWLSRWSSMAESMRTDQDLNNYGHNTFIDWAVGQRAINNYRQYAALQVQRQVPVTIYPDLDSLFVANSEKLTGVNDSIRTTLMSHWLGAGANLILGSDMTQMDSLGYKLLTSAASVDAADFFARYPMQPRNPGTGGNKAQQLQAWIAGPRDDGVAYALVANYGPDGGQSGYGTKMYGPQKVTVSLDDLGIAGNRWKFNDVWDSGSTIVAHSYSVRLREGASVLLRLTRVK